MSQVVVLFLWLWRLEAVALGHRGSSFLRVCLLHAKLLLCDRCGTAAENLAHELRVML